MCACNTHTHLLLAHRQDALVALGRFMFGLKIGGLLVGSQRGVDPIHLEGCQVGAEGGLVIVENAGGPIFSAGRDGDPDLLRFWRVLTGPALSIAIFFFSGETDLPRLRAL